jgi:POT family proton-dependent oligopeptide transporter
MKVRQNATYTKNSLLYSFSLFFDRAAFYGFRAIIVLHLLENLTLDLTRGKIYGYLGVFSIALLFSKIIGAFIGDLAIGNRKATIIGAFLQASGVLFFWNDSLYSILIGAFLILTGGGLYSANLTASFGKEYTNKLSIIDSAFTFLYILTNLGSFIGILALGYISEINFKYALALTSILFFLAGFISLLTSDRKTCDVKKNTFQLPKNTLIIIVSSILMGAFWFIYELNQVNFQTEIQNLIDRDISNFINPYSYSSVILVALCIVLIFLWHFVYVRQIIKIALGFILTAIGIGLCFYLPEIANESKIYFILINFILVSLGEALIAPTVNALITKYTNSNYLAIVFSIIYLPSYFISKAYEYLSNNSTIPKDIDLKIGFTSAVIITLLLCIAIINISIKKRKNEQL